MFSWCVFSAWAEMREAVAHHAARAGEKLRAEGLVAGRMMVFLHTNPHNGDPWHSASTAGASSRPPTPAR